MFLVRFIYTDTHLNTGILQLHPQITQYIDTIIRQLILLAGVMHTDFKIIIILQDRLAIDHRILKIHFLVNRCGVIIPFTNQGIIVKGSYYLLYVRCRLLNGLLLRLLLRSPSWRFPSDEPFYEPD